MNDDAERRPTLHQSPARERIRLLDSNYVARASPAIQEIEQKETKVTKKFNSRLTDSATCRRADSLVIQ